MLSQSDIHTRALWAGMNHSAYYLQSEAVTADFYIQNDTFLFLSTFLGKSQTKT